MTQPCSYKHRRTASSLSLVNVSRRAYLGLLEAGRALPLPVVRGAVGVLLVGKGLKLPQVHHGFDHHLQRAHTMGPAPARAPGGVGGDLADDSVLE